MNFLNALKLGHSNLIMFNVFSLSYFYVDEADNFDSDHDKDDNDGDEDNVKICFYNPFSRLDNIGCLYNALKFT